MTALAFDLQRLHSDIDQERQRQDLSWTALSRQVRVGASTIRRYAHAEDAEADGVLTLIQWLDEAPEDYITDSSVSPAKLPPATRGQIRVDMNRVAQATNDPRGANGRTRPTSPVFRAR